MSDLARKIKKVMK